MEYDNDDLLNEANAFLFGKSNFGEALDDYDYDDADLGFGNALDDYDLEDVDLAFGEVLEDHDHDEVEDFDTGGHNLAHRVSAYRGRVSRAKRNVKVNSARYRKLKSLIKRNTASYRKNRKALGKVNAVKAQQLRKVRAHNAQAKKYALLLRKNKTGALKKQYNKYAHAVRVHTGRRNKHAKDMKTWRAELAKYNTAALKTTKAARIKVLNGAIASRTKWHAGESKAVTKYAGIRNKYSKALSAYGAARKKWSGAYKANRKYAKVWNSRYRKTAKSSSRLTRSTRRQAGAIKRYRAGVKKAIVSRKRAAGNIGKFTRRYRAASKKQRRLNAIERRNERRQNAAIRRLTKHKHARGKGRASPKRAARAARAARRVARSPTQVIIHRHAGGGGGGGGSGRGGGGGKNRCQWAAGVTCKGARAPRMCAGGFGYSEI